MVITKLLACDTEPLISSYEDIARHLTDRSFAIFNLGPSLEPLLIFTRVRHRLDFRLKMSVAKSGSIVHTEEWKIENFDDAMKPGRGGVKSDGFHISGVPGEFQLVISPSWKTVKLKEFEAKHLFLVNLTFTSVDKDLKAAGKLELVKEGEKSQWGKFGDPDKPTFVPVDTSTVGGYRFESNTGLHCTLNIPSYRPESTFDPGAFFTTGSTGRLNLVATITIPGKLVTLGGGAEVEVKEMELFDFKPLLKDPKHSDVVLKCGDTRFLCHKVILAAR